MSPQWIPQNIQKRLLLYVLQQLSLFSEIDLPNLEEVSLNNIVLKNIAIDPEKVGKLPGCNLRYGQLGSLELATISGISGVNIEVNDVELVISPDFDIDEDIANHVAFLLAQSTADLANTIMLDSEIDDDEGADEAAAPSGHSKEDDVDGDNDDEDDTDEDIPKPKPKTRRTSLTDKKPSTLGGVMQRAVEMALLRLQVKITNLRLKIVSELTDLLMEVDTIDIKSVNGTRNVKVEGARLKTLKPLVNPGEFPTTKEAKSDKENEPRSQDQPKEGTKKEGDDDDNDSNDSNDADDYGDESLMDSMVFTHEEANSIYMSATSQSFEKSTTSQGPDGVDNKADEGDNENKDPPIVFHMDECSVEFDGLSTISNLEIEVGTINLAFTPLTPTLISILQGVTKSLKIKYYQKKKSAKTKLAQRNERFPQYAEEDDEVVDDEPLQGDNSEDPFFNKLKINNFVISTTSALSESGQFTSNYGINIIFSNINIKQKNELLLFGGIESVKISRFAEDGIFDIFQFERPIVPQSPNVDVSPTSASSSSTAGSGKADVRYEVYKKAETANDLEITILMAKSAYFNFDLQSFLILSNFAKALNSIIDEYGVLKKVIDKWGAEMSKLEKKGETAEDTTSLQFILQTASIFVNTVIAHDLQLQLIVFPIKFNLLQELLTISKILLNSIQGNVVNEGFVTISDIAFLMKSQDFRAFIQSTTTSSTSSNSPSLPRLTTMTAKLNLSIQKVAVNLSMERLKFIGDKVKVFLDKFVEQSPNQLNSLENSFMDEPPKKTSSRLDGSMLMASSLHYSTRRTGRRLGLGLNNSPSLFLGSTHRVNLVSFQLSIKEITVSISNVFPKFGDLNVILSDILMYKAKQDVHGHILYVGVDRKKDNLVERLVHQYQDLPLDKHEFPLILIKCKLSDRTNKIEIIARNLLLEYYTHWLLLMNNDESIIDAVEEEIIDKVTASKTSSPNKFDIRYTVYDCMIGLTPGRLQCKTYLLIGKGNSDLSFGINQFYIKCSFRSISMVLIDDVKNFNPATESKKQSRLTTRQVPYSYTSPLEYYLNLGYIQMGSINVAHVGITFNTDIEELKKRNERLGIRDNLSLVDLKINSDEHQINLCADSANTLMQLINDLKLPLNFKDEDKMKVKFQGPIDVMKDVEQNIFKDLDEEFTDLAIDDEGNPSESSSQEASSLVFEEDHFEKGSRSVYENGNVDPLHININLSKTSIYLHDGYDWKETRKAIRGTVKRFEKQQQEEQQQQQQEKENQQQPPKRAQVEFDIEEVEEEEEDNQVLEETLYQSIHLSAPRRSNAVDLTASINLELQNDDDVEDADKFESNLLLGKNYKNLKLRRSVKHKILMDLKNIEIGVVVYSTRDPRKDKTDKNMAFELLNMVEIRVNTVNVYDNLPSSTWNKFLGYMNILGEREIGTNMLNVTILNVRPDPSMVAAEAIMNISILPLRLHIDQDTLDFMARFFEFKDDRFELPPDEIVYIQKFEMSPVKLKVDYKPKKVDYASLRSGKAGEFANFFTLDGSTLTLPKVKLFGLDGAAKIGAGLGKAYIPIFQLTQVIGIIAGLSPLRSVVNIGGGFKDLIAIPINEYKKDGRLWRSIQKGTSSFAKTTGYELLNLGVKLASGTQVLLEQGEELFGGEGSSTRTPRNQRQRRRSSGASDSPVQFIDAPGQKNLLESSQLLNKASSKMKHQDIGANKLYSNVELDDDEVEGDSAITNELLSKSIFLLAPVLDEKAERSDGEEEYEIYPYSLYANQPESIEEGLKLALKNFSRNIQITKEELVKLQGTENAKGAIQQLPVILLRPMIGTSEAIANVLMGISNTIDKEKLVEKQEKYGS
ncbi:Autophagy-related protein 2 [Candida viswanathii]|uniref:Autophagy-related protein 2 n=1 Tax=Candida viswanathii TaxID=5486 RepID=A0A367YR38_9ASCO|nr:Autophagy-related protein 2 [Candida viswanathii]